MMPMSRREARGSGSLAVPVLTVVVLIASYVLLTEWQDLPEMISAMLTTVHAHI
jgi:hypothetical protein